MYIDSESRTVRDDLFALFKKVPHCFRQEAVWEVYNAAIADQLNGVHYAAPSVHVSVCIIGTIVRVIARQDLERLQQDYNEEDLTWTSPIGCSIHQTWMKAVDAFRSGDSEMRPIEYFITNVWPGHDIYARRPYIAHWCMEYLQEYCPQEPATPERELVAV